MKHFNGDRLFHSQMLPSRVLACSVALLVIACTSAADKSASKARNDTAASRRDVLGCYRLYPESLTTSGRSSTAGDLPSAGVLFQLDSSPLGTGIASHPMHVKLMIPDSAHLSVRFWSPDSTSDSIRVTLGTGYGGYRFVLLPNARSAEGSVLSSPEGASVERTTHVTFSRVVCAPNISPSG
jgi:hypothetical protein